MMYVKAYTKPSYFVVDTWLTKATCALVCYFGGPISRRVIHKFLKTIPQEVASDGLLHTYNSYISTLYNVLYQQDIPGLISDNITNKIALIHGENDTVAPIANIRKVAKEHNLKLTILQNEAHGFPLEAAEKTVLLLTI